PSWGSAVEQSVDQLGFTGPVTKKTATLISCDATVDTILVDGAGAPLDVGRMQRLFSPRIRKALIARDGGCAFPGCGRPASWCDAHHIQAWEADGVTSVDNGVMLCRLFRYRNNRHYAESAVMPILRESVLVSGFSVEL
ncbi:HNH endonuclease, partial [Mycolicibacterium brumae]|nr:HNH endonuclease [Mycolicibacterium brumae]